MKDHPVYRADIDGLRAIACLMVVVYHFFPEALPGGFVGVDIFFVISGFLITGILLKELDVGKFSIWHFYARRIKRIFPALIVILMASWALGYAVLYSNEYKQLGKHIAASSLFISNFAYWQESGYFDTGNPPAN